MRVRVEQYGEVLGADVQPAAADDARVHAHAQQLDLVLEVALRTRRSAGIRPSAGGLGSVLSAGGGRTCSCDHRSFGRR